MEFNNANFKKIKRYVIAALIGIFLAVLIINSIGVVPVNHTGVWKRLGVVQERAVPEGVHLKIPFVDSIEAISNQVQTTTIFALVKAEQDRQTQIIQANAQAEAQKIEADNQAYVTITIAEADRDARLAAAEATKAELEAQAAGLTDLVVQRSFIEKWDGHLIPSFGGSSINLADFTDIYESYLGIDQK